jgi:hypothetical protein
MNRCIVFSLIAVGISGSAGPALAQKQSEKQVSGPEQMNSKKSTGKSYKRGTTKPSTKEKNPSTGQTRRLGNTGDLTKNGDDVNGKRAEKPNNSQQPKK